MNAPGARTHAPITLYTRPGCRYCFLLRQRLRLRRLTFTEINIWTHPDAAAAVRTVADGNETVPTVHVAGQWLINPRAEHVGQLARA